MEAPEVSAPGSSRRGRAHRQIIPLIEVVHRARTENYTAIESKMSVTDYNQDPYVLRCCEIIKERSRTHPRHKWLKGHLKQDADFHINHNHSSDGEPARTLERGADLEAKTDEGFKVDELLQSHGENEVHSLRTSES
jgi:hypothetical protein